MKTNYSNAVLRTVACASLLLGVGAVFAAPSTTTVNLTAQAMSTTLPDGSSVPMWGYCTTGSCSASWSPGPTITVPYNPDGNILQINLTNALKVPTSIVILGQYGGGLGLPTRMPSPAHNAQNFTTFTGNAPADIPFTPPAQAARVKSFATEVAAGTTSSSSLTWNNLKPGTYIYETGTLPSVQAPMGLYGVLIVTQAPVAADATSNVTFAAGKAYPGKSKEGLYDSDVALLFSEIDPVQNKAVDNAATAGTDVNKRFNDPSCTPNCYPAAVNYTPTYFLINGKWFDQTAPLNSALAIPETALSGNVLVRLLNAGLRTHTPVIAGQTVTLLAEDGNVLPGKSRDQNEVLLPAGKTHDVLIHPVVAVAAVPPATGKYAPATNGILDRQLSLTTNNQPNGGQQGFLQIAGGTLPSAVTPLAVNDSFQIPFSSVFSGNVTTNDVAVTSAAVVSGPSSGSLTLNPNGTFTYTPNAGFQGTDTFKYNGNGGTTNTATVSLNVASTGLGAPPVAANDTYTSNVVSRFSTARPGVLTNDTDPSGYPLKAVIPASGINTCGSVTLNADGSFTATPAASASSCQFTYTAVNSQNTASAAATVSVTFGAAGTKTGLTVAVVDAKTGTPITDYRWTIQEDLTFKVDPSGTPTLTTRTLGTSFHKSHMPVVATGCVGPVSCGSGQNGRIDSTTVDPVTGTLGLRQTLTDADALALQTLVGDVALDPNKHYYISVLPGDAQNPIIDGSNGHMMGGTEISPQQVAISGTVKVATQATPLEPAQLSIFIYEDNAPTNGQSDLNENGLGGFNIILVDPAGRPGDPAGQQTYDAFNMPLTNALLGTPGCPDTLNATTNGATTSAAGNLVGVVYTCPNAPPGYTGDPAIYTLAGHALIKNLTPARYDVIAHPAAARQGAGEIWWQTETLEGTPAQDAFVGINEPRYFQEFGPPGFHTTIGFVNPNNVKNFATANQLTGSYTITGNITNQHMSRPSDVTLWDSGAFDLLSSTTCEVALNSQGGTGPTIATAQCDKNGNFTIAGVPAGTYEVAVFDQWLDQIIQTVAVTVVNQNVAMGNIPVLSWFTQHDQNIFLDTNKNGKYDDGEPGISNVPLTVRYRDGGISSQTLSDSAGNGILVELFPLFNWYVSEADTTRFKQTGVNIVVDGGGKTDTTGAGAGLITSHYATGESSDRTELPGAYSYGIQGFISQRNRIDWGRTPYVPGENGGIQGMVVYSSTRPFDDQRLNVQTLWEPLVPRVTVNLYKQDKLADGTETLTLVDTTQTSSWDDFVNKIDPVTGKQVNMQCPGQRADDPFLLYTLATQNPANPDQFRCYDGFHNWNQVQAAPYDGRYNFPSATYVAAHPLTATQVANGQTLVSLPQGKYVVETVTPPGYVIVKEEDKNILVGDAFNAPAVQQFGALASIFILPDQATLNNGNPYSPQTGDPGFNSNATTNLGSNASQVSFAECVGSPHRVPDYLSLFPQVQQVAPFAGMDRPLCDRKLVNLGDQMQASTNFFVFTEVPMAGNGSGIILDDASAEFNAASPDFGEKASVPFVPVSLKDYNGVEINRAYADQWGTYNMMTPSSWLVNPPTPSGYGPNMLITCINDPGPISIGGKLITDPQFNPSYSNFCYTIPFMPGRTTYLDTPVLPIASFASGYTPADCAYPDATPAIQRVDTSAGFGPYLPTSGGTITIKALGDVQVLNPGYAGPFADPNNPPNNPAAQRTITRHYGFGAGSTAVSKVTIGGVALTVAPGNWTDSQIIAQVPEEARGGELVVTADNGNASVDTVTVTIGGKAPTRVQGANGQTIQAAIDAATPGDLILVDAGTYNELVIMWKPVRLQGVGAASVIINAAKYPNSKLSNWRTRINDLFAIDINTGNQAGVAQIDPLPTQEITGGIVLLEPTVLGTEEGAGITVLAKNLPARQCNNGAISVDASGNPTGNHVTQSNFLCAPSRIDGVSVTGGDAGGGIYVNGWAHNLEIANNRVYGNAGALHGGVRVGVPYLEIEALNTGRGGNVVGFGYDNNVNIHHNAITKNGTVEGPAGAGGAGGGVSICTGTDGYSIDHNWICGNYSSADGGGIGHVGFSQNGSITKNTIMFNQSFQQTNTTHGGGIIVTGEPAVAGALSLGTGNVTIDSNLIRGNFAEGGQGGGVRLQQVNGADVALNPNNSSRWFQVKLTNNMVENNVAGWAGGGISLADALLTVLDNNTVASNDSVGIAGVLLTAANGATTTAGTGSPSPSGVSSEPTSTQLKNVIGNGSGLSAVQRTISSPELTNDIIWKNRSFFYKVVAGKSTLCSSNNAADAAGTTCNQLVDQILTGQCVNTNGGSAPAYWDIGVVGDTSVVPPIAVQPAAIAIASFTRSGPLFGGRLVTITTAVPLHDIATGQSVTIAGFNQAPYNGPHTVVVTAPNRFTYIATGTINPAPTLAGGTATPPLSPARALSPTYAVLTSTTGYTGANNSATDPLLLDMYCNGSRVTPEFTNVLNPPSVKNLQVAATVDEGNNYVSLRFGPLYQAKPNSAGTTFTKFGDYHLASTSTAVDTGTPVSSINHDIDGDQRGPGATGVNGQYDRGADEVVRPAPIVSLSGTSLVFGSQAIGTTSAPLTLTVSNVGGAPLIFNAAAPVATAGVSISGNFAIAAGTTCVSGGTVASGASCVINVTFSATAPGGAKSGTLTLRDNAGTPTQTVSLSGTAAQGEVSFSSATLGTLSTTFGQRTLAFGNLSGTRTSVVTLTNTGNAPVIYGTATVSNSTGTAFSKGTDSCAGNTVAAGATCTITINFAAPANNSNRVGTLSVPDNGAGSPQTLRLTGS